MKVFLTGGSGFVGSEILRRLNEMGHSVRLLARDPKSTRVQAEASRFGAELHQGNVLDAASLTGGLSGMDAVINLVGIISECGRNTYENVHTGGARNLVEAARKEGVPRFIQMSGLGTRPGATARYHQSKWEGEEIVRSSGLAWTIFRPSVIYGPQDQFVNLFAGISRVSPFIPVIGDGRSKLQPIPVESVAAAFVGALSEPKSVGGTYDLCGPTAMPFEEILRIILEVTRRKRRLIHLPLGLARIQARMLEWIFPTLLHRPPPLNRDQLIMLGEDNVGNSEPANGLFGLRPIAFRDGISKYLG